MQECWPLANQPRNCSTAGLQRKSFKPAPTAVPCRVDADKAGALAFSALPHPLLMFPICRAPAATTWAKSKSGRSHVTYLHRDKNGKARVLARLPIGFEAPRLPSAADMECLLRLIAISKLAREQRIKVLAWRAGGRAIARTHTARPRHRDDLDQVIWLHDHGMAYGGEVKDAFNIYRSRAGRRAEPKTGSMALQEEYKRLHLPENLRALGSPVLEFRSVRALLVALRRDVKPRAARQSIERSLRLWNGLRMTHQAWRDDDQRHFSIKLRFIRSLEWPTEPRQPVRIQLDPDFFGECDGTARKIILRLEQSAAAFNLIRYAACWIGKGNRIPTIKRRFPEFGDLVGLHPKGNKARQQILALHHTLKAVGLRCLLRGDAVIITRRKSRIVRRRIRQRAAHKSRVWMDEVGNERAQMAQQQAEARAETAAQRRRLNGSINLLDYIDDHLG